MAKLRSSRRMMQNALEQQAKIEQKRKEEAPKVTDPNLERFRAIKKAIGYRPAVHFAKPGPR